MGASRGQPVAWMGRRSCPSSGAGNRESGVGNTKTEDPRKKEKKRCDPCEVNDPAAVGSAVTTVRGKGVVNTAGRFLVAGVAGDEVVLHTDPPRLAVVPAEGGIVFP